MYSTKQPLLLRTFVKRTVRMGLAVTIALILIRLTAQSSFAAGGKYNWPQFGFDQQHSGNDTLESAIQPANVGTLTQKFQVTLSSADYADGAPVFLGDVTTKNGVQDLLFITTRNGDLLALDALTGAQVWRAANPALPPCMINHGSDPCYTTSSPAIDPNSQYVYTYGLDGKAHKYTVGGDSSGNPVEITTGGWPEIATLKNFDEKGSSALSIATDSGATSYLYVTNSSFEDAGDYQGHITAINLATGAQNVFNALCSDDTAHLVETPHTPDCFGATQAGVWARPGTIYDSATNKIYFATGNAAYNPAGALWGDSVLALHPDGTGNSRNPVDAYTPTDQQSLNNNDQDLGSTAPAVLPVNGGHHYAVQGGKDARVRIVDLDNLSGSSGFGNTGGEISGSLINIPTGSEVLTQPAVWTNPADGRVWVFVATYNGLNGLLLNATGDGWVLSGSPASWTNTLGPFTSPIVANGVLFAAYNGNIVALDPTTGTVEWTGTIGNIHWQSPIVANGILYMLDNNNQLTAFTTNPVLVAPTGAITNTTPTFTWKPYANAWGYYIYVADRNGNVAFAQWVGNPCNGTTCSFASPITLTGNSYIWWVAAYSNQGWSPWSNPLIFALPPTLIGPSGSIASATPNFTWNAVINAWGYYFYATNGSTITVAQWVDAASACNSTTCTFTSPVSLSAGSYIWTAAAYSSDWGWTAYPTPLSFTDSAGAVPPATLKPTFQPPVNKATKPQ